jgi:signal transduction histidine kinase
VIKTFRIRNLIKLIGPYPYNPYLLFLFFFSFYFSRYIRVLGYLPAGPERWRAGGLVLLAATVPAIIFSFGSILLSRFRFWSSNSTILYILEVGFFQYLNLLYLPLINKFLQDKLNYFDQTIIALSKNIFIASLVLVLIALAMMHQAERKISERLSLANKLVEKLENERAELVHSEETLRRQTSQFLHDRVQSDLMVVGMKLKSISGRSTPEVNAVIERAIERLENTRAADLKNLIQILTPNLDAGSLSSALDTLMEQYQQSMGVIHSVDADSENLETEIKLGIYRIIEQALLNSLIHGPAHQVQINVTTSASGITKVIVADDGPGATLAGVSPGIGSAIIDSWVGILSGTRSINTSPGHGYRIEVEIPQEPERRRGDLNS